MLNYDDDVFAMILSDDKKKTNITQRLEIDIYEWLLHTWA